MSMVRIDRIEGKKKKKNKVKFLFMGWSLYFYSFYALVFHYFFCLSYHQHAFFLCFNFFIYIAHAFVY
jgi:hypothetical protein